MKWFYAYAFKNCIYVYVSVFVCVSLSIANTYIIFQHLPHIRNAWYYILLFFNYIYSISLLYLTSRTPAYLILVSVIHWEKFRVLTSLFVCIFLICVWISCMHSHLTKTAWKKTECTQLDVLLCYTLYSSGTYKKLDTWHLSNLSTDFSFHHVCRFFVTTVIKTSHHFIPQVSPHFTPHQPVLILPSQLSHSKPGCH